MFDRRELELNYFLLGVFHYGRWCIGSGFFPAQMSNCLGFYWDIFIQHDSTEVVTCKILFLLIIFLFLAYICLIHWLIEPEQTIPILIMDKFVLLLQLCIRDMMFIIKQQRCCRVALHFTWFVVFLALIWHDVYNYGI